MIYTVCSGDSSLRTIDEQREASRALLEEALCREYGIEAGNRGIMKDARGKPYLQDCQDIHFNISHCQGGVALSLSSYRTGIDIERARPFSGVTAAKVLNKAELFSVQQSEEPEREFFRFWTLKESYVKAIGVGLAYPMNEVCFAIGRDRSITCNQADCGFCLLENDLGFITAVCYLSEGARPHEPVVSRLLP